MSLDIFYYSNRSGNTKRFVNKLGYSSYHVSDKPLAEAQYILCVPTYGGGDEDYAIPRAVDQFLSIPNNRKLLRGVIGIGNRNFGSDYCKAAKLICDELSVPLIGKVELFGTPEDVTLIQEGLTRLNEQLQLP